MRTVITTSPVDCPENCGILATVKDGRIVKLEGNPEHGYTRGFLCKKGYRYLNRVYSTRRVLFPQKKVGSGWKRISWDEALDTIAEKIRYFQQKYGNGSIMHFQGASSWGSTKQLVKRFFNLLGGVTTIKGSLCSGSARAAQEADTGVRLGNDPESILSSKAIIIWGRDPVKTSIHLLPLLRKARKQGAPLILIDPIRTKTAFVCDEHVAPRPGSDGFLAIGMAKELLEMDLVDVNFIDNYTAGYDRYLELLNSFSMEEIAEKCDFPVPVIKRLAHTYGRAKPASILLGWGINKWEHSPEMIRLIDALGALTGNIGVAGGGVNHGFQTGRHFDPAVLAPEAVQYRREIAEPLFGQGIMESTEPPVKMIWINGINPVVSCPNSNKVIQALKGLDFIVVVDHFVTDTADLADIFLPTTTFFEEEDIVVSWGHNWIGPVNRAIEPLGEAKSDLQIAQELSKRLGLEREMEGTPREWLKRILKPMEEAGLTVERVMQGPVRCPVAPMVAFEDRRFLTPSGRFEFIGQFYKERRRNLPYCLLTPLSNSWLLSLILEEEHPDIPLAIINPAEAGKRGIVDESRVLLKSNSGELVARARLSNITREDTIVISHGTWIKKGGGVNQLTDDLSSTTGNMAAFYSTTVAMEPLPPA